LLHQKHRDCFGKADPDVLVVQAGSTTFNPTLNASILDAARRADPEAAQSEWDAQFRSDLSSLLDDAVIDAAIVHGRPLELPPDPKHRYIAFVDASAGRHDQFTIAIGHVADKVFVADVIRGRAAPFNPNEVAAEYAQLARDYRCPHVTGDNFAGEWVAQAFRAAGIRYEKSSLPKSAIYLEGVPAFNRGAISIPDHPRLSRELRLLERRVHRSGKDSVDHPQGGSDDHANALFGAAWLALQPHEYPQPHFAHYGAGAPGAGSVWWPGKKDPRLLEAERNVRNGSRPSNL